MARSSPAEGRRGPHGIQIDTTDSGQKSKHYPPLIGDPRSANRTVVIQANGYQRRMPTLPLITGDMLHSSTARLAGELRKACLVDLVSTAWLDADRTNMVQALDQAEYSGWLGGFRDLPQPGQPALTSVLSALHQRIKPPSLVGRQPISQPA